VLSLCVFKVASSMSEVASVSSRRHEPRAKPPGLPLIARIRFQLLGGLALAMLGPLPLQIDFTGRGINEQVSPHIPNTLLGVFLAVVVGYYVVRRLIYFPGIASVGYVPLVFTASYLAVITLFFFLRFDYLRFQFLGGYGLSVAWFMVVNFRRAESSRAIWLLAKSAAVASRVGALIEDRVPAARPNQLFSPYAYCLAEAPG